MKIKKNKIPIDQIIKMILREKPVLSVLISISIDLYLEAERIMECDYHHVPEERNQDRSNVSHRPVVRHGCSFRTYKKRIHVLESKDD